MSFCIKKYLVFSLRKSNNTKYYRTTFFVSVPNLQYVLKLKFQVQVSHLLKFIGYLVFVGYLAAKDSSDSSFNKHSRGVA